MSLPSSSVPPNAPEREQSALPARWHLRRWQTILLIIMLALAGATAWQWLNKQQTSMVAGRPLSYQQTHLHTVVFGSQPGVVYLGTHYGLFTSTDGGQNWPQSQGALNTNMVTAVAVSPTRPASLAVLAIPNSGLGHQMGIYVSADGGNNWRFTLPANLPAVAYPYSIQSAPGSGGHFYAFFTSAGWFETRDLGQHWTAITSGNLANIQTPSLWSDPADQLHLLMGGDLGLFETRNDGQSWQQITAVQGAVTTLAATNSASSNGQTVLIATDHGLYRWQEQQSSAVQLNNWPATSLPTRLAINSDGNALYALAGPDLWFSNNQGISWSKRWHFTRGDLTTLAINPTRPTELLAGFFSPGLVLISTNSGNTWQTLTS